MPHVSQTKSSLLCSYRKGIFFLKWAFSFIWLLTVNYYLPRIQPCFPMLLYFLWYPGCTGILPHSKLPPSSLAKASILDRCSVTFLWALPPSFLPLHECSHLMISDSLLVFFFWEGTVSSWLWTLLDALPGMGSPDLSLFWCPCWHLTSIVRSLCTVSSGHPSQSLESTLSFLSSPGMDYASLSVTNRNTCIF